MELQAAVVAAAPARAPYLRKSRRLSRMSHSSVCFGIARRCYTAARRRRGATRGTATALRRTMRGVVPVVVVVLAAHPHQAQQPEQADPAPVVAAVVLARLGRGVLPPAARAAPAASPGALRGGGKDGDEPGGGDEGAGDLGEFAVHCVLLEVMVS